MKKAVVLGAGMVGSAIAADLCLEYQITVIDLNKDKLDNLKKHHLLETKIINLEDEVSLLNELDSCDLVIGAVPGYMGYKTLKKIINAGKDVVDISFFDEDPFELDSLAKEKNITAIVDCGVAPGLSNIVLGHYSKLIDVENFECMVGGLPYKRNWPFQYKAPFSPSDVIEEYTRPARMVINGKLEHKEALTDIELVNIEPIGTLEAFNTDGLRTLLKTMKIPNMKEKTLRYPGHTEYVKVLRETGFFSKEKIEIGGAVMSPLEMTKKIIFPKWKLEDDEKEFTVMEIIISGTDKGEKKKFKYNLFDKYDEKSQTTSMARTTGYTCTAAARLVLEEHFTQKGICPPEFIGMQEGSYDKIHKLLKERNIISVLTEVQ